MKNEYYKKLNKLNEAKKELELFENSIKVNIKEHLKGKTIQNFKCIDGDEINQAFKDNYCIEIKSISENKVRVRLCASKSFRYCGLYKYEKYININKGDLK